MRAVIETGGGLACTGLDMVGGRSNDKKFAESDIKEKFLSFKRLTTRKT
jgi:hypothetical protein